ncbi:DUF1367 family protein [Dickeya zeae]|uniref:DUF1367 family protein n=1 Tax=Dickeya zeae TaxID=204042 RepID=UPI001F27027B|nr:DUF1367 family protein [Dickeya zeae]
MLGGVDKIHGDLRSYISVADIGVLYKPEDDSCNWLNVIIHRMRARSSILLGEPYKPEPKPIYTGDTFTRMGQDKFDKVYHGVFGVIWNETLSQHFADQYEMEQAV